MKKIIALALSLMLLIGCVSALAEAADKHPARPDPAADGGAYAPCLRGR